MLNRRRDDRDRDFRMGSEKVFIMFYIIGLIFFWIIFDFKLFCCSSFIHSFISVQQKRFGFESPELNIKNDIDRGILPGRRSLKTDRTPMIYVCATMWHETQKEMIQILTSLFR